MFDTSERSIGQLFADLGNQISTLISDEIQLAKLELTERAKRIGRDATYLVAGGLIAWTAFLGAVTTVILLLAIALPVWLAALITTALLGVIGWVLIAKGLKALKQADVVPRQTVQTIRENFQWAKQHVR